MRGRKKRKRKKSFGRKVTAAGEKKRNKRRFWRSEGSLGTGKGWRKN